MIAEHFKRTGLEVVLYSRTADERHRPLASLEQMPAWSPDECLLHLGWSTLPLTSERLPGIEKETDLPYLERLLANLARHKQRPHFIFFSSGGTVYGDAPGRPNTEDDACHPIGNYGRAKLAAENLIREHADREDLSCTILRLSNPYGYPVEPTRVQGIIPHAIRCALAGDTLTLWGDGSARKDFIYYEDFLAVFELIVQRRLLGTFNVCAGNSHSINEILELVANEVGRKVAVHTIEAPRWDVHDSRLDNRKLIAATDWRPRTPLREGIRRAVLAYRASGVSTTSK